jgi:hypothetical protein
MNTRPSDRVTLLDTIDPVSQAAATVTGAWLSAADFFSYLALLSVGALGASATVDAKLEQATDDQGTGAKDIVGKAITQLTDAGTDDNKQVAINLRPAELDAQGGFTHFRLSVTVATQACLIAGHVFGLDARNAPGTHDTTLDEVVG